jgi:protein-L-isoaspartate(D-aspartate) O-methyltransferase
VTTRLGDGAAGWPGAAPFDGILVTAAIPRMPPPLLAQVAPGGRIVAPVGDQAEQELIILELQADGWAERSAGGVRFVPLISRLAFPAESP